jgi:hypothetical protein
MGAPKAGRKTRPVGRADKQGVKQRAGEIVRGLEQ